MIELLFICCLIIIWGLFLVKHLLFYSEDKSMKELFDKLPQIKPHWFYGNNSSDDVYKAMKGVRLGVWYTGRKRQLFAMDPDLIHKIIVTDFDHFVDSAFLDPEYSKVSLFLAITYGVLYFFILTSYFFKFSNPCLLFIQGHGQSTWNSGGNR